MRPTRLAAVAAILASTLGTTAAQAGGQYQLSPVSPTRIVPIMHCEVQPFGGGYAMWVYNGANVAYTLPAGTQIYWATSNGSSGIRTLGDPLAAGQGILFDVVPGPQTCSARVA